MNKLKKFDNSFLCAEIDLIAGVDEAGRGPLAGPVVAAAVIFDKDTVITGVDDSKKLSQKIRELLFDKITSKALAYGIGIVDHNIIDEINILQATLLAMSKAVDQLSHKVDLILIDGNRTFESDIVTKSVIKGDSTSFSIASASIIAKVTRDKIMSEASHYHPEYKWNKNNGYGTREHIEAIKTYGITSLHRKSFLSNILDQKSLSPEFD